MSMRRWPGCASVAMLALAGAAFGADDFLTVRTGAVELRAAGYFQGDVRAFPGWDVPSPDQRDDGLDVRRLRVGLEMTARSLSGEFVVDAADLVNNAFGDDDHRPAFTPREHFKNVYLELALGKRHYLRAGNFKLPVSREFLTSAAKTDFVERSMLGDELAPNRDWGVMAGGKLPVARGLTYMAGVFAGDGWADQSRAGTTGATRLVLEPLRGLQIGVDGSLGNVKANPEVPGTSPETRGLHGKSAAGWTFFHRLYVDGQRRRLGGDVQYAAGPLTLKAEALEARDERHGQGSVFDDVPPIVGRGWSASAVWRVRGPRSKKDTAHGRRPLDLAARYESLRFDDTGPGLDIAGSSNRAGNVRPQSNRAASAGVSYQPGSRVRLMGNVVLDHYPDRLLAPESGRSGYVTLLARLQLEIR
jgi:phosphate-selective porin